MLHQFNYKFNKFLFASLIILFISSCSTDNDIEEEETPLPLDAIELLNVSYGAHVSQKYDVYLPADRTNLTTKVFVLVHGGSWVGGDKNDMNFLVDELKLSYPDYAIVNINYRLGSIGNSPFPMQLNDIASVILDLENKEETYQITDDFGFIGVSAGAHLSMVYAYDFDFDTDVKFVSSIVGPTNFTDPSYTDDLVFENFRIGMQLMTGVSFDDDPQFYENYSPYHVATITSPPTILFYGGQDELVPTSQGVEMHAKLDELGITNEFTLYENEGHGWEGANFTDTLNKLSTFIDTHF
ncbi:MAG: alpha/beta hydrolase [Urechidicola sp.]|nr:alpha/beta hydrolase [Urechidicola sp.]